MNTSGRPGEILSLGFASIYHGRYVEGDEHEWLLSLTSPLFEAAAAEGDDPDRVSRGFGAPLWVILVSVLGAVCSILDALCTSPSSESHP